MHRPPRLTVARPLPRDARKRKSHPIPCTCLHEATLQTLLATREGAHADPNPAPPLQNPALLSSGKQPALKYSPYFPGDSELPARLARADSLRCIPQLQHLILVWWDGHGSHPVPSTAGTRRAGSSPPQLPKRTGCLLIPVLSSLHYQLFPLMCP